jgi:hypothetical protein
VRNRLARTGGRAFWLVEPCAAASAVDFLTCLAIITQRWPEGPCPARKAVEVLGWVPKPLLARLVAGLTCPYRRT